MKILKDLLHKVDIQSIVGSVDLSIDSVLLDSRQVDKQSLFVAIKGSETDGHIYITAAIEKGAVAIVCEQMPQQIWPGITYICVSNASQALAIIANNLYDQPSTKLKLVGVTGTNGKTTVASLLFTLFKELGYKVGLLSTVKIVVDNQEFTTLHTTPDSLTINYYLQEMVDQGCEYCFMEVSSHGIVQSRTYGLEFCGGIFTNLTHDHLDYHQSFANYRDAKKMFFDQLAKNAFALTNSDDKNGLVMVQNTRSKLFTYALKNVSDFKGVILESQFSGMLMRIDGQELWVRLIGRFNAYNLLAVYGAALALGQSKEKVLVGISTLTSVNGRFQYYISKSKVTAIVDYAHTPDALENVISTINSIRTRNENLFTIVGCGGNRDATKRPIMAHIASSLSDKVILTSDNPRFEQPESILRDMEKGVEAQNAMKTIVVQDRDQAIKLACMQAKPGDIILIAGKGHETYQEIKGVRSHFNDLEIVTKYLEK
ncbi:UDP-N-acetylmuramoyl-L-alanyl-D-glutamate--2,6-diaminopimelate ligase [Myroides sp. LJL119]